MLKNIFYVYVCFRPWDGSPCYVGKGHGSRWLRHQSLGSNHPNRKFASILKQANKRKMPLIQIKIRQDLSEPDAFAVERALIVAIGRGPGRLVNSTSGGQGCANPSKEARQRMGVNKGRKFSEEHKAKIRAAVHATYATKDLTVFKVSPTDEQKAKISATKTGKKRKPFSASHRANLSKAGRAAWARRSLIKSVC